MPRKAVSVTLDSDNLLWLRGQVRSAPGRTLSAVLDRLIDEARSRGRVHEASIRSVVGTIGISPDDPDLASADAAVRAMFPLPSSRRRAGRRRG
jgi:hypothetical protein